MKIKRRNVYFMTLFETHLFCIYLKDETLPSRKTKKSVVI